MVNMKLKLVKNGNGYALALPMGLIKSGIINIDKKEYEVQVLDDSLNLNEEQSKILNYISEDKLLQLKKKFPEIFENLINHRTLVNIIGNTGKYQEDLKDSEEFKQFLKFMEFQKLQQNKKNAYSGHFLSNFLPNSNNFYNLLP